MTTADMCVCIYQPSLRQQGIGETNLQEPWHASTPTLKNPEDQLCLAPTTFMTIIFLVRLNS